MSAYRVCMMAIGAHGAFKNLKSMHFDKKEDAEHYAKNQSVSDPKHSYDVQQNAAGKFTTLKSYVGGEEE